MSPQKLAHLESVRLFSVIGRHVAVVTGKKPRGSEMPRLVNEGLHRLVLELINTDRPANGKLEAYVLVQPVHIPAECSDVQVWHADGCIRTKVETLRPDDRTENSAVLGISQDFSLEMAIKDALLRLEPNAEREPQLFEVVSMGALYGGFSGFSRLFVRMAQADSHAAPPPGTVRRRSEKKRRYGQDCPHQEALAKTT